MTNPLSAEQVAERLTRYYLAALSIMAILCLMGLGIINSAIQYHESDGRVLNISGRQRMLSQQLTKLALLKTYEPSRTDSLTFAGALHTWQIHHGQLEEGILLMEENYPVKKSRKLSEEFRMLQPVYLSLYNDFELCNTQAKADTALLSRILTEENRYLRQMDSIVFQFERESRERVRNLKIIEYIMASVSILTLLLEVFLVFRPIVKYTRSFIHELSESKKELFLTNQELHKVNYYLSSTQQEVLNLYEARHNQLRMEEQVRSAALMEGQEKERMRLARELHDGVGQMLTGLNLLMGRLRKTPAEDPRRVERMEEISACIQEIIRETRHISHNVMPDTLSDYGLVSTLKALTGQIDDTAASYVSFEVSGQEKRLTPAQEIGLYRIAQEALTNALKYAGAPDIALSLNFENDKVVLQIKDNGKGFRIEEALNRQSLGLDNMRTRAQLLGTEFLLESDTGKGTSITVTLNQ